MIRNLLVSGCCLCDLAPMVPFGINHTRQEYLKGIYGICLKRKIMYFKNQYFEHRMIE